MVARKPKLAKSISRFFVAAALAFQTPILLGQDSSVIPSDRLSTNSSIAEPMTMAEAFDQPVTADSVCLSDPTEQSPSDQLCGSVFDRLYLTGDWLGARTTMLENGLTWNIYSTNFTQVSPVAD